MSAVHALNIHHNAPQSSTPALAAASTSSSAPSSLGHRTHEASQSAAVRNKSDSILDFTFSFDFYIGTSRTLMILIAIVLLVIAITTGLYWMWMQHHHLGQNSLSPPANSANQMNHDNESEMLHQANLPTTNIPDLVDTVRDHTNKFINRFAHNA